MRRASWTRGRVGAVVMVVVATVALSACQDWTQFMGSAAHTGDNPGFRSFAAWIPDRAASLVVLANDENPGIETLVRPLLPVALEPFPD